MKIVYTATATVTEGRAGGHARSSDGELDVKLVQPKEMGGPGVGGTNPEQLFAAGYAACFQSACRFLARQQGKTVTTSSATAHVGIGPRDAGGFALKVSLEIKLDGISREDAEDIAQKAHAMMCPYSNAVRGNVDVAVKVL